MTTDAGSGTGASGPRPLVRLVARDGLLLQAEHLTRMQDYSFALSTALGRGGGAGVVEGFGVGLRKVTEPGSGGDATTVGWTLAVEPGLAHDAAGRTLLLRSAVVETLNAPTAGDPSFRRIVVRARSRPTGEVSQLVGDLCGDPCGGESDVRPYLDEGVEVVIEAFDVPMDAPESTTFARSALASAVFRRERTRPGSGFLDGGWTAPGPSDSSDGVALGVLIKNGSEWEIDTWTVRRERTDALPLQRWNRRLGMRPWSLLLAEMLQFQDHLAGRDDETRLEAAGIRELPPAAYLPVRSATPVDGQVAEMLGDEVDLRFWSVPADEIALAVEQARHRDRIPLAAGAQDHPEVDVLVPDGTLTPPTPASLAGFAAVGPMTVTDPSDGGFRHAEGNVGPSGLGRIERSGTGAVTVALAAYSADERGPYGLWLDVWMSQDPAGLAVQGRSSIELRFVATHEAQPGAATAGAVQLRVELRATFTCQKRQSDEAGTTVLSGVLSGGHYLRLRGSTGRTDRNLSNVPADIRVERRDGTVTTSVTVTELSPPERPKPANPSAPQTPEPLLTVSTSDDSEQARVELALTTAASTPQAGSAQASAALRLGIPVRPDPSASQPGGAPRQAAEAALRTLSGTEFGDLAPELLYAGDDVPVRTVSYETPHGWVLVTRRSGRESGGTTETTSIRFDVYAVTLTAAQLEAVTAAPATAGLASDEREYVDQVAFPADTLRLDDASRSRLASWRAARSSTTTTPRSAVVWFGTRRVPVVDAVGPVLAAMTTGPAGPVVEAAELPGLPPTPGSAGVIAVLLSPDA